MFFSPNKVKELVKTWTNRQVTQEYIFSLIIYLQEYTGELVKISEKELEKKNELRRIQGLYQKKRIDRDCLRDAIIFINLNRYGPSPEKAGGTIKEGEKNDKHTPKHQKTQGVEIT